MRFVLMAAVAAGVLALGGGAAHAANPAFEKLVTEDLPGAKDHPLVGRYTGSKILLQSTAEFDSVRLPVGKGLGYGSAKRFTRTVDPEGRVTRTVYIAQPGRSSLEVFRNHQAALQAQGFTPEFECAGADGCGESFKDLKYNWNDKRSHVQGQNVTGDRARFAQSVFDGAKDIRYGLFRKGQGAGATYVGVYVALNQGGGFGDVSEALNGHVTALIEVVEPKAMEQRIDMVKADAIGAQLRSGGSVSLYGLLFDTDSATLKPESKPQLDEMVRFLKGNAMKVYIVGHTDDQGALDYNLGLSDRRAKSVAQALAAAGVPAARIAARGVGPLAPVAPNAADAGRAKNRRVELVPQ